MRRTIYLGSMPLHEALRLWSDRLDNTIPAPAPENTAVINSVGRVTAEAVFAAISSPFYHSAAMDGYAVRAHETFIASETYPLALRIPEQAVYVDTGDPLPKGFNAVIMLEDVNIIKQGKAANEFIEIIRPATPWQHIRIIGEDIVSAELILPANHRIRPADIGAMLAGGITKVLVRKRPRVAIIPTGTELVEPGSVLKTGSIIESNSRVLSGLVSEWGCEPVRYDIVADDIEKVKEAVTEACSRAELVVINAGSSAGSEDYTAQAVSELGEVLVHGVAIKPGRPVLLGIVKDKPVLGIPGYPVSAYITFSLFAKPLLQKWSGLDTNRQEKTKAVLSRQIPSAPGYEEFIRLRVGVVGDRTIATPMSRGAGVIMSLVKADAVLRIPSVTEGLGSGSEVDIELMRPLEEIRNTIVCIGSHDNALDILSDFLKQRHPLFSLSSAHVGSMGGLIALRKGEAHMAGIHLLDEETGEYNIPFIKKFLPEKKVVLINLAYRQQGLIVKKGNPKNITGFGDLVREDVVFINRQAGSGTRLLTDKHLKESGIQHSEIKGYDKEEYTHMGIASAVLTGLADTGLATLTAANALGLAFIPVAKERYDLALPCEFLELEMIQAFLRIIREDTGFRYAIDRLGGYDLSDMGRIIFEG